jgi:hypothetical protein
MRGRYVLIYAALLLCGILLLASSLRADQIEVKYEVGLGDLISSALAASGIFGLLLTLHQISHAARSSRAQFVLEVNKQLLVDDLREFYYRLDYSGGDAFKFDEREFMRSEDEPKLDRLLYTLSYVGKLLRNHVLEKNDLLWVRTIAVRTVGHQEVLKYLHWLKLPAQIPDHSGFVDAVYLYEQLEGRTGAAWPSLSKYLESPKK